MSGNNSLSTSSDLRPLATDAGPPLPPSGLTRRQQLFQEHPEPAPEKTTGSQWFEVPNKWSSTALWMRFRDTVSRLASELPDDPDLPNFLSCANQVIAWRATIQPNDRFWKAD